jgi:hypothetical protein
MKDLVAEAVARTLGLSSRLISGWELNAQQNGMPGTPGMIRTELRVRVVADRTSLHRLQMGERRGSWALQQLEVQDAYGPSHLQGRIDVVLLYGKETQHIFKALAQLTVYRRNQKGKKR